MDADTAHHLLGAGLALLDDLPAYDPATALAVGTKLRANGHDPAVVAAVLVQAELRMRARTKFGEDAARMLFTRDGLEQATRQRVADHHAGRFAAAGISRVADLGCGIGADALALARTGVSVDAVDAVEGTALLAHHNLTTLHPEAAVGARHARAEDVDLAATDGVWLDPARRTPGRTDSRGRTCRTFRLDDMAPSWQTVLDMAGRARGAGVKLSPSFPHEALPDGAEAEWVSESGDLVECSVWWGPLAQTPGRTATVIRPRNDLIRVTEADAADAPPPGLLSPAPGHALFEPDLAILQAGLVGALARAVDGSELWPGVGYVVARDSTATDVPYARRHEITHVLPAQVKAVKTWLRREGHTGLTIKRRGGTIDPGDFRRRLGIGTKGGDQATLLLTVGPDGPVALVLE